MNYINLTSGLEFLEEIPDARFIRIQSSLCESKCWSKLIEDLDYDFLINLAQGKAVYVYDTSRNHKESRALFQGLEFIWYVLQRRWFNKHNIKAVVRGNDATDYFMQEYNKLSDRAKKKIDYIKKFLNTDVIYLGSKCKKSEHDGDYKYYKNIMQYSKCAKNAQKGENK